MNSQASKMRLISMFYLMVFASALLFSGIFNSQKEVLSMTKGKSINVTAEPGSDSEDVAEGDEKPGFSPFEFDFSFSSLLQWFFRLPVKNLSVKSHSHTTTAGQPIWASIFSIRI